LTPLTGLTQLTSLILASNPITDLTPLVDNAGLDAGDYVSLDDTPFSCATEKPKLQALSDRGVLVYPLTLCP
jgi:hypothetical protein